MTRKWLAGDAELQSYLGVSKRITAKIISDGLPVYRVDWKYMFRADEVDQFMKDNYLVGKDPSVEQLTNSIMEKFR